MKDLTVKLEEEEYNKLLGFKRIFETITDDEIDLETFVQFLLGKGMDTMIWDIIPQDATVLRDTINNIKDENPAFFVEFVINTLKRGAVKEEAKKKIHPPYG